MNFFFKQDPNICCLHEIHEEKRIQLRISCSKSMLFNQVLENKLRFTFNTQDEVAAKCKLP